MTARILGLERFQLTSTSFFRLGKRRAAVRIYLKNHDITPTIISSPPEKRAALKEQRWQRWCQQICEEFPTRTFKPNSKGTLPSSQSALLFVSEIQRLAQLPAIHSIFIEQISGFRHIREPTRPESWRCIRARVAVQIEKQTRGLQTIETRLVLVRGFSFNDAQKRLRNEWPEYAKPYLNPDNMLVRWKLEEIVDGCEIYPDQLDPKGTEVFSKLKSRRMKPAYEWHPRKGQRFSKS